MTDKAFDDMIKGKLDNYTAPVSPRIWEELRFDAFAQKQLNAVDVPVSSNLWSKVSAAIVPEDIKAFDSFVQERLTDYIAPIPTDLWDKVKPEEEDRRRFLFWLPRTGMVAASLLFLVMAGAVSAYLYYDRIGKEHNIPKSNSTNTSTTNTSGNNNNGSEKSYDAGDPNTSSLQHNMPIQRNFDERPIQYSTQDFKLPPNQVLIVQPTASGTAGLNKLEENDEEVGTYTFKNRDQANYLSLYSRRGLAFAPTTISDRNHTNGIKSVIICPSDRKSPLSPDWDVEVFAGPNYGVKSLMANTASAQYMNRKDSSEAARIGYTVGFNIVKPLNERLLVKTGLQYTQVNEKFTYRTENEVRTTTVVSVRTIIRAPGDTVIVRDTSTLQQIGFKNHSVNNSFRSIDIPIVLGYKFGNDEFSVGVNAGVIVNLRSMYKGVVLDTSFTPVTLDKSTAQGTYKNNIGLGLYGGIQVTKKLNYNTYIFAEPFVRYNLSNSTVEGSPFHQRFTIGGLAVGLKFNLNSR